jgi:hypothetical protein
LTHVRRFVENVALVFIVVRGVSMRTWSAVVLGTFGTLAALAISWLTEPAQAAFCFPICVSPSPAPGPLIGVGLPAAAIVLATLFVARRFRGKE